VTEAGEAQTTVAPPCDPVDTTGAGDTFDAAFLDGWLAGRPLAKCLHRAALAGAAAVGAVGGTSGQPSPGELDDHPPERS
jgi:sugar/nucleoside kinase (ribokinase family)